MSDETVTVVGKESVGKSELVASLTGDRPTASNFRGTTVRAERYSTGGYTFVDTPGIVLDADTEGTRAALDALGEEEKVMLVVPATDLDEDLGDLLPLVEGHVGSIVVTFWDKVDDNEGARLALEKLEETTGVPVTPVDARNVERVAADGGVGTAEGEYGRVLGALDEPGVFPDSPGTQVGWGIEPPATVFERDYVGPWVSVALLLLPTALAVWFANSLAGEVSPVVDGWMEPVVAWASGLPEPLSTVLATEYGLLSMGPFLFVWAGPTMLIFAVVLGVYKNTGLVTRITVALHPYMRRVGLTGRDLVRVVMGFGCNVPAVVNTRSCSDCTRKTTISAISFGSACSYQFPATLAVFATVGMAWLVVPYVALLAVTTLIYVGVIAPREAREASLFIDRRNFLSLPDPRAIGREAWSALREFFLKALPVFVLITFVAALLDRVGAIDTAGSVLGPVMSAFALPAETALVVVLASVRKDGIALFTSEDTAVAALSPLEVLVAVYLAGVLLPCLVTAFTVAREVSARYALVLMARQAVAAVVFSLVIAWGGRAVLSLL
jgi:ferrous iron transport protein B